jgi:hypothetical protein
MSLASHSASFSLSHDGSVDGINLRYAAALEILRHRGVMIGGETNQYDPAIYLDTVPIGPEKTPEEGYHFTEDMTDKSIDWVRQQKALMPDRPFFMYWAPALWHCSYSGTSVRSKQANTIGEPTAGLILHIQGSCAIDMRSARVSIVAGIRISSHG